MAALTSTFWSSLGARDFAQLRASAQLSQVVAVLPVAATEQHGPHLPTGVDTVLVDGVVRAALPLLPPELPVLVLPTGEVLEESWDIVRWALNTPAAPSEARAAWDMAQSQPNLHLLHTNDGACQNPKKYCPH